MLKYILAVPKHNSRLWCLHELQGFEAIKGKTSQGEALYAKMEMHYSWVAGVGSLGMLKYIIICIYKFECIHSASGNTFAVHAPGR
jgi:hypothetical protein